MAQSVPHGFVEAVAGWLQNEGRQLGLAELTGAALLIQDLDRRSPLVTALYNSGSGGPGGAFTPTPAQQAAIRNIRDTFVSTQADVIAALIQAGYQPYRDENSTALQQAHDAEAKVKELQAYNNRLEKTVVELRAERDQLHALESGSAAREAKLREELQEQTDAVMWLEARLGAVPKDEGGTGVAQEPKKRRREPVEGHPRIYSRTLSDGTVKYELRVRKGLNNSYTPAGNSLQAALKLQKELEG